MKTNEEILASVSDSNIGDVALGRRPNERRNTFINQVSKLNIEPGELVNRANPRGKYQFAWADFSDREYIEDLRDTGYKPVVETEWITDRWDWETPDASKRRWSVEKHLVMRDMFLWYRNEDLYRQEQAKRLELVGGQMDALYSKDTEAGLRQGLSVEGQYAGKEIDVRAPKRRSTVV